VRTVFPVGTTIYDPDKCYNGYTLFPPGPKVTLIDMNGNVVNEWDVQAIRAKLLRNGNLLVAARRAGRRAEMGAGRRAGRRAERRAGKNPVQEFSWDGRLVWEYVPPGPVGVHHDVTRLDNGNTFLLSKDLLPDEYRKKITDPVRRSATQIRVDLVLEVTPEKEVVWEWHMYEHVDVNRYCEICNPGDWTHVNTVRALPENRHYDAGDERFRPGNIILSPRNLSFIFIVDKKTKEIVWEYTGTYAGGLAGQHEPYMIEKGLPGEGNIIVFDNGAPPMRSVAHTGNSYIIEIDPVTEKLVWKYEDRRKFYSPFTSSVQRLPNGNTLICESGTPRIFEVTREGEIVWEHTLEMHVGVARAYRYPYDYCPQLRALKKPKENRVTPPPHAVTRPRRVISAAEVFE